MVGVVGVEPSILMGYKSAELGTLRAQALPVENLRQHDQRFDWAS